MRRLLTAGEAKALDRYTITEVGVPSVVLMERASFAVAEACEEIIGEKRTASSCGIPEKNGASENSGIPESSAKNCVSETRILCVCAMGNNGADGVAVARILYLKGYAAEILLVCDEEKATEEMKLQLAIARNLEIPVCKADEEKEYIRAGEYDLIVDGLFGVGLTRPVEGPYAALVRQINESHAKVIAVDIPSGISADDGKVLGCAVRADVTVTFGVEKLGMVLYPGTEYCGRRVIADIGLAEARYFAAPCAGTDPFGVKDTGENTVKKTTGRSMGGRESREEASVEKYPAITYDKDDIKRLPARPAYSNKGTFGRVLVIAGSANMGGAALFAGMAAYRMGAGLVEIATVAENRSFLMERLPEAVLTVYDPMSDLRGWLPAAVKRSRAVVVGPGMGTGENTGKILNYLLNETEIPLIIDADGLNVLAVSDELSGLLSERVILTPHLGEMSRLTGKAVRELQRNLIDSATEYSRTTGAVCVMKDARTIVASPNGKVYVNTSGNCGMATGGSGDLLAGMLGALRAEGMDPFESACLGVYLHGLYGDKARERYGVRTMIASDFGEIIGESLR